jgi:hypothetical protein
MLNVSIVLDRMQIRRSNVVFAVADTANYVSNAVNPIAAAQKIFKDVINVDVTFKDAVFARMAAKCLINNVIHFDCILDEDIVPFQKMADSAIKYAETFVADPKNSYLWAQPSEESIQNTPVQFVEGIDCKVVVNENGGLKKGGKKVLSFELYDKHILKAPVPSTRKEFISILVEQLGLTVQAASTYHYNLKSGQPGWIPQ